jgi:hypothetical protein
VLGARFLDRFGTGTRSAPRDALIASSADEEHRGKAFGLEGVGDNLGAFLGPLMAVFLLLFLHVDMRLIFYLAVIPGLLAVLMIVLVRERSHDRPSEGTTRGGECKIKARCEFAVIPQSLLEISARDCIVRNRQLQHCISYPPDPRCRHFSGGDDIDLRGIQFGGRADFVSRWISIRQMAKEEHLAVVVHHLLCQLPRICLERI